MLSLCRKSLLVGMMLAIGVYSSSVIAASCGAGEPSFVSGYQNFPGKPCADIPDIVADYTKRGGFRKQCQKLTAASSRPKAVASVLMEECGALRQESGSYASMRVCCEVTTEVAVSTSAKQSYNSTLNCPEGKAQAVASNLHYPGQSCAQARSNAESRLTINAYKRACENVAPHAGKQTISDAKVIACDSSNGAMLDVSVCCSAQAGRNHTQTASAENIWEIVRTNNLGALQLLLSRQPAVVKQRGKFQETPLHLAGSVALVNALLSKRADVGAKDQDGQTALFYAARNGNQPVVERLIAVGAKVTRVNKQGDTPLSFAKNAAVAKRLLKSGARVNGNNQSVPLHSAAFNGRLDVVKVLLQHGADINRTGVGGETALHRAAFRQKLDMVKLLVEQGANVNIASRQGRAKTPLDMTQNAQIRTYLKQHGARSAR